MTVDFILVLNIYRTSSCEQISTYKQNIFAGEHPSEEALSTAGGAAEHLRLPHRHQLLQADVRRRHGPRVAHVDHRPRRFLHRARHKGLIGRSKRKVLFFTSFSTIRLFLI